MKKKIAILGAGITGLSAAREAIRKGYEVDVYEDRSFVGGLAAAFKDNDGFIYDNGPRFIFSTLAEKIGIADICSPIEYYEYLHVKGKKYIFPFGFIKNPKYCLSIVGSMITRMFRGKPTNLKEFLITYYGKGFSGEVLQPLIEKWSGIPSQDVSIDFTSRLLPTNLSYIFYSLIKKFRKGVTEDYYKKNRYIVYPKGGNAKIFEKLLETPGLSVHLNSKVEAIHTNGDRITNVTINGRNIEADYFISTIPISDVPQLIRDDNQQRVDFWKQFKYRGIIILFIKLNRDRLIDGLWHWYPEKKYPFYRVAEYKNARRELAPEGKTLISVECSADKSSSIFTASKEEVFEKVFPDLEKLYGFSRQDLIGLDMNRCLAAYPILQQSTENAQRSLQHTTPYKNLFIAGRTGMFQYKMTEGSYDSAISCIRHLTAQDQGKEVEVMQNRYDFSDSYGRPNQIPE